MKPESPGAGKNNVRGEVVPDHLSAELPGRETKPRGMDVVGLLLRWLEREHSQHYPREPDVYWVVDLCRCSMKREMELRYPELCRFRYKPHLVLGTLVHHGVERLLQHIIWQEDPDGTLDVSIEPERTRAIEVDGREVEVRGRPDLIIFDQAETGHEVLVEIKTGREGQGTPHEHHVDQVRAYLWLTGIKRGILLYVLPDALRAYEVCEPWGDDDVIRRIRENKAPRYGWECKYCDYSPVCPIYGTIIANQKAGNKR